MLCGYFFLRLALLINPLLTRSTLMGLGRLATPFPDLRLCKFSTLKNGFIDMFYQLTGILIAHRRLDPEIPSL